MESDPLRFPKEVVECLSQTDYPFVGPRTRIVVLKWLCQQFLSSKPFREQLKYYTAKTTPDEHCRECGKTGEETISEMIDW